MRKMKLAVYLLGSVILALVVIYKIMTGSTLARIDKKVLFPSHTENFKNTLTWAVKINNKTHDKNHVSKIASDLGLICEGQISKLGNIYIFHYDVDYSQFNKSVNSEVVSNMTNGKILRFHQEIFSNNEMERIIQNVEENLDNHADVEWHSHQKIVSRSKRSLQFQDPFYSKQWHLHNHYERGMDINVTDVWEYNVTGRGITVAVVDDGLEWNNPDLQDNYNKDGSWDFNGGDPDPMPDGSKESNHHGTRCAGEIAAVPNNVCGVGVAFGAKVSGVRILDGPMTDSMEGSAFTKNFQINDVYSCSWGPDDDGRTVDGPHVLAAAAIKYGIDFGRHGYGNIYIVASGNGGHAGDNCNYDGYANSIYTVTIGAVDETGHMPYYSEECASMLAVTFSSGGGWGIRDIVTTDWTAHVAQGRSGCTEHHTGTSAAAPIAAGLVALMLEVQPCLTWRDVQYLIILTAQKVNVLVMDSRPDQVDIDEAKWQKNGAGLWHSHKHGFGLMKAWRLVNAAKVWNRVPWLTSFSYERRDINLEIPKGKINPLTITYTVTEEMTNGYDLYILETVQVTLSISHPSRGLLEIKLISPHGTMSVIGASRPKDNSSRGFDKWTFSTVRCWGETPVGTWILTITDKDKAKYEHGHVTYFNLKLYGTLLTPKQLRQRRREIEGAMSGEMLRNNKSTVCLPPPISAIPAAPLSQKTLKFLSLTSAFLFFMAVYESLEYLFCYNEEKTETSKLRKLVTRAHRLVRNTIRSDTDARNNVSESTGLLTEDIPMQTLNSEGQGSRSESSRSETTRSYRSSVDESHFGAYGVSSHIETLDNSIEVEAETSLDTALPINHNPDNIVSSSHVLQSRTFSIINKITSAIFPFMKKKSTKYLPLENCDNSDSEETVIYHRNSEPVPEDTVAFMKNSEPVPEETVAFKRNTEPFTEVNTRLQAPADSDSSYQDQAFADHNHILNYESS